MKDKPSSGNELILNQLVPRVGYFEMSVSCGNRCDISYLEVNDIECNDDGTYYLTLFAEGQYLPLNGDRKVVVGAIKTLYLPLKLLLKVLLVARL